MARYADGGKATVESCRSIDVLDWHRRGYLRWPRSFSWSWIQDGERVAWINVETQRHGVAPTYGYSIRFVLGQGKGLRYGIGVGREREWPDWNEVSAVRDNAHQVEFKAESAGFEE